MKDKIRFINLDDFISMVEDGTFIYLQANKEDVINAAKSMAVYEISKENVLALMRKFINGEEI